MSSRSTCRYRRTEGDGLDELRAQVVKRLPEGPEYFPPDHVTDQPARFLAAELIREKILLATRQEVPHAVTVMVDKWEETPGFVRIYATILVERDGQKAIVIGVEGFDAEEDRHAGARGDGSAVRHPDLSGSAREGGVGVAGEAGVSQYSRLAYNGRKR